LERLSKSLPSPEEQEGLLEAGQPEESSDS